MGGRSEIYPLGARNAAIMNVTDIRFNADATSGDVGVTR